MTDEPQPSPQQPAPGTDSRVDDWHGQSARRDAELADDLVERHGEDEAEAAFEERSDEARLQERRRGDVIDPDQGQSAYREQAGQRR